MKAGCVGRNYLDTVRVRWWALVSTVVPLGTIKEGNFLISLVTTIILILLLATKYKTLTNITPVRVQQPGG